MTLQESSLIPMGDAPSAFACGSCFEPISKEDQLTLCSGDADDALENVDCPACGDYFDITEVEVRVHPEATPLLSMETVLETEWFHVSWSSNWHASLLREESIPYVHAGNRQSAIDRYEGLYRGCIAYLYKFKLAPGISISDVIYDDLNEWPEDIQRGGLPYRNGREVNGVRYVNRWESPGSISILVNPMFIVEVSSEQLLITEEDKAA